MTGKTTITFCACTEAREQRCRLNLGGDSGNDFLETSTVQGLSLEDKGKNIAYSDFVLIAFGNFIPFIEQ